jgi:hypothetical protein
MNITKCDICKKEIKDYKNQIGVIHPEKISNLVFCLGCGEPILKFLKKHNLAEKKQS